MFVSFVQILNPDHSSEVACILAFYHCLSSEDKLAFPGCFQLVLHSCTFPSTAPMVITMTLLKCWWSWFYIFCFWYVPRIIWKSFWMMIVYRIAIFIWNINVTAASLEVCIFFFFFLLSVDKYKEYLEKYNPYGESNMGFHLLTSANTWK